jgi:hypothetical protein
MTPYFFFMDRRLRMLRFFIDFLAAFFIDLRFMAILNDVFSLLC